MANASARGEREPHFGGAHVLHVCTTLFVAAPAVDVPLQRFIGLTDDFIVSR
jgi:hypothetical protein